MLTDSVLECNMHKLVFLLIAAALFTVGRSPAQELNIGVHLNPILTHRVLSSKSVYDKEVRPVFLTFGYNAGFNLNYKLSSDVSIETGVNLVQKFIRFNDLRGSVFGAGADYYLSLGNTFVEVPLLFNYRIYHHDRKTNYDLYILGGAAYEKGNTYNTMTGSSSFGNNNTLLQVNGSYTGNTNVSYATAIIGFKINAVLRRVGLIDYGVSYHLPLQAAGPYNVSVSLGNNSSINNYSGAFYARMSYIDFKLCYYFLNLNNRFRRIWYREGA